MKKKRSIFFGILCHKKQNDDRIFRWKFAFSPLFSDFSRGVGIFQKTMGGGGEISH